MPELDTDKTTIMDAQTMLICITIFIASAVIIYFISILTMREKTYEEVLAEQRQRQEQLVLKSKAEKKEKTKKKYRKGKGVEKGDRSGGEQDKSDVDGDAADKMLQYELEPEIIEPVSFVEASPQKQKKSKKDKPKSILANKNEKSLVRETAEPQYHRDIVPKDMVELEHDRQRRASGTLNAPPVEDVSPVPPQPKEKGKKEKKQQKEVVSSIEEPITVQKTQLVQAAAPPAEHKKRNKAVIDYGSAGGMYMIYDIRVLLDIKSM